MKLLILKNNLDGIKTAAKILKKGGLVAIPTETVYGLAANALDKQAVAKIFEAKKRPADNPLIIHIAHINDLEKYTYVNETALKCAKQFWPGPFTMILPKKNCIPTIVSAGLDTVAIRFPANTCTQAIIKECGFPLAAPSANISGKPSPTTAQHVLDDFAATIDAVLDGGECKYGVESTVITLAQSPPVLLRPGAVTPNQLKKALPTLQISEAVLHELPNNVKVLSPGLKHKHYAPSAKTTCIVGTSQHFIEYIHTHVQPTKKSAIICFDHEKTFFSDYSVFAYGKEDCPEIMAAQIFDILRKADALKVQCIYIHTKLTNDIGLAVYNRLLRACAFDIIDIDTEYKE